MCDSEADHSQGFDDGWTTPCLNYEYDCNWIIRELLYSLSLQSFAYIGNVDFKQWPQVYHNISYIIHIKIPTT